MSCHSVAINSWVRGCQHFSKAVSLLVVNRWVDSLFTVRSEIVQGVSVSADNQPMKDVTHLGSSVPLLDMGPQRVEEKLATLSHYWHSVVCTFIAEKYFNSTQEINQISCLQLIQGVCSPASMLCPIVVTGDTHSHYTK